jgi:hypothetical protein
LGLMPLSLCCGVPLKSLRYACSSPSEPIDDAPKEDASSPSEPITKEEKLKKVGNLIVDDKWDGLSTELAELVRILVIKDMKKNAREFLGKEEYKVSNISKEIDFCVKTKVANLCGKEEYELGDFIMAMDELSKGMTEELTGKPYEAASDLSKEIDTHVKSAITEFCGKDE